MGTWNSSPHPISDVRDWQRSERLEIQPDFQRREVWSTAAKVMLMDTILKGAPMPKVFLSSVIKGDQVHRVVIDGQQRTGAILEFLRDGFVLSEPYDGPFRGLSFSKLPKDVQDKFLQYRIDFNEAIGFSDAELREIYSRLNKYSFALTKQELRRADFPGNFLDLSEKLASNEFLEANRVFSVANRRRLGDVEFVSELLAALISGPLDKREELDDHYLKYSKWDEGAKGQIERRFESVLVDLATLFSDEFKPLRETRFRQKADFYSLFLAIDALRSTGCTLDGKHIRPLQEDLEILDENIEPSSYIRDFSAYAVRCVSQANSVASRRWRSGLLKAVLAGTYCNAVPTGDAALFMYRAFVDFDNSGQGMCPDPTHTCPICSNEIKDGEERVAGWEPGTKSFQMSNLVWLHAECSSKAGGWMRLVVADPNQEPSFGSEKSQTREPVPFPNGDGGPPHA